MGSKQTSLASLCPSGSQSVTSSAGPVCSARSPIGPRSRSGATRHLSTELILLEAGGVQRVVPRPTASPCPGNCVERQVFRPTRLASGTLPEEPSKGSERALEGREACHGGEHFHAFARFPPTTTTPRPPPTSPQAIPEPRDLPQIQLAPMSLHPLKSLSSSGRLQGESGVRHGP